ncbi:hypothetical protein C2S53_001505 [Perilla frutescens var. hirtella]|uniref:Uncharacterized protein n=1 Tax=Perilla frutescens var. hirtella TaxID=608512 RepID=A0AAD4J3Q9_PERFH|nr:hypothetical protein C2S53_001505 [Perilla frutescens var. hirtella]
MSACGADQVEPLYYWYNLPNNSSGILNSEPIRCPAGAPASGANSEKCILSDSINLLCIGSARYELVK